MVPPQVAPQVGENRSVGPEFVREAREQTIEDQSAAQKQDMDMAPLRHALARLRGAGEGIALNQGDVLEVVGENACCEQARHTAADHKRVTKWAPGHAQALVYRSQFSKADAGSPK
jgi:hypothetical protein